MRKNSSRTKHHSKTIILEQELGSQQHSKTHRNLIHIETRAEPECLQKFNLTRIKRLSMEEKTFWQRSKFVHVDIFPTCRRRIDFLLANQVLLDLFLSSIFSQITDDTLVKPAVESRMNIGKCSRMIILVDCGSRKG